MELRILVLFFLLTISCFGQDKKSKADNLFFGYAYKQAIAEYKKEMAKTKLDNQQYLNLADAYLKTGDYKNAATTYTLVYKRDSTLSNHNFNKMLLSIARTDGMERVNAYLATKKALLPAEWIENANFNAELLDSDGGDGLKYEILNIRGNSAQADFSPTFYGEKLLFTSSRSQKSKDLYIPSGESFMDIFIGRVSQNGDILNANAFNDMPPSKFHEATPFYSQELESIFYMLSNAEDGELSFDENGKNALAIGMVDQKGVFKYLLRDLGTSFYYPFYDAPTGKLYFSANFGDSYGGTDIYYVYTNQGQIMSAPVNLGPRINTAGNEIAPFVFDNSLYFSSDVFYGLGGMDIYRSNLMPDDSFSIPVNLGREINSTYDDFGFIIKDSSTGGLMGYFASNREGGKGKDDIYSFSVSEKPGLKTLVLSGTVAKPSGTAIDRAAVRVYDMQMELLKEVYTNENGQYQLEIPWRDSILVGAAKERFSTYTEALEGKSLNAANNGKLHIALTQLEDLLTEREGQKVIKLNKFFFDRYKNIITPGIALELDKVVEAVKNFPKLQLRIETHTDSRGGGSANLKLSQQRADAIKKYLLDKGVSPSNILYTVGYGEDKILNNCTNGVYCLEMLHQQNDRSLIVVLNYDLLF
ncbi:MAG: OmpA family protein [Sediminicola sp.]